MSENACFLPKYVWNSFGILLGELFSIFWPIFPRERETHGLDIIWATKKDLLLSVILIG